MRRLIFLIFLMSPAFGAKDTARIFDAKFGPFQYHFRPLEGITFYRSKVFLKDKILIGEIKKKTVTGMIQNQWFPASIKEEELCDGISKRLFPTSKVVWKKVKTSDFLICDPTENKKVGASIFVVPTKMPIKGMKVRSVLQFQWNEKIASRELATRILESLRYE